MENLVIVESPAKAKTIEKYLGAEYKVKASMGHLRDLPKKEMGVDLEHGFAPDYVPIEGKEKLIEELSKAAKASDRVYLATDPDREGEAISWHLKELLQLPKEKTCRVTFNEITPKAVKNGVAHPREIDENLVGAQQARRILDRIVGYKLSPFLWRKVRRGLSAGRVQSVVTRMVVDREREIRAFKPEEYWTVTLSLLAGNEPFSAAFYGADGKKKDLKTQKDADTVLQAIAGQPFSVEAVRRADKKKKPAPPFTTSTLQQEASRKLGMTSKRTMAVAQALYEGVEIKGIGPTGLITYMRTDSIRVAAEAVASVRAVISESYGENYLPRSPRMYKSKKDAQDAHEAVRPTHPELSPEKVKGSLTPDQYKLYRLIWNRFTASQMAEQVLDTVSADIVSGGYLFRATGYTVKFNGFTAVYEESVDDGDEADAKKLPPLQEGMALTCEDAKAEQHFTQPPPRFTEASLIKAMEENGVGRPSTYAPTISTVVGRDYVTKEGKSLKATALGEAVTDLMIDRFTDIVDLKFTASMEESLDEVENGHVEYHTLLRDFYDKFASELGRAEEEMAQTRVKVADEESDVVCELCGRKMVVKYGRFGKFLACPGYPECKNTKPIAEDSGGICPLCGGRVLKKKSKKGYAYYGCEKNPACGFMTWDVPQKRTCPNCGGTLFKRFNKEEKKILCLKEGCGYEEPLRTRGSKAKKESAAAEEQTDKAAALTPKAGKKSSARGKAAKEKTKKAPTGTRRTAKKSSGAPGGEEQS